METTRHNLSLKWCDKIVIAPRRFMTNNQIHYVHICGFNCDGVQLYEHLRFIGTKCVQVASSSYLKLYSNTKGLYFNYSYWLNNCEKKTIRVYLCD